MNINLRNSLIFVALLAGCATTDADNTAEDGADVVETDTSSDTVDESCNPTPAPITPDFAFEVANAELGLPTPTIIKNGEEKPWANTVVWADINGSGLPDLLVNPRGGSPQAWLNVGPLGFDDFTTDFGFDSDGGRPLVADLNDDGRPDIYVAGGDLWLGTIDGPLVRRSLDHFDKVQGVSAADIDGDGDLDLFLARYEVGENFVAQTNVLLLNDGDANFTVAWTDDAGTTHNSRDVSCVDYDQDGSVECYVSNYRLAPNQLLRWNGSTFIDLAVERGVAGNIDGKDLITDANGLVHPIAGHTVSSVWVDLNGDGYLDLFVANLSHDDPEKITTPEPEQDWPQVFINQGPDAGWTFETTSTGIEWQESHSVPRFGDVDNDGDLDLFLSSVYSHNVSKLWLNDGTGTFFETAGAATSTAVGVYDVAFSDYDRDGCLDLWAAGRLLRNTTCGDGNWIELILDAGDVGAKVSIETSDGTVFVRHVLSGTGGGNTNNSLVHIGLGGYFTGCDSVPVTITWRDGTELQLDLPLNDYTDYYSL